jgi:hypothetical protein
MKLILFLFLALPVMANAPGFDQDKWMRFVGLADQFHRKLIGCPKKGFPPEVTCLPGAGIMDYRLWRQMQDEAKDLFGGKP